MNRSACLILICISMAGCVTPQKPITQSQLAGIEKGKTTQGEVQALFGTPTGISTVDGEQGMQTVYNYASRYMHPTKANYANAMLDGSLVQWDNQFVTIFFSTNGIVQKIAVTQGGLPPPERQTAKPVRVGKTVEEP